MLFSRCCIASNFLAAADAPISAMADFIPPSEFRSDWGTLIWAVWLAELSLFDVMVEAEAAELITV